MGKEWEFDADGKAHVQYGDNAAKEMLDDLQANLETQPFAEVEAPDGYKTYTAFIVLDPEEIYVFTEDSPRDPPEGAIKVLDTDDQDRYLKELAGYFAAFDCRENCERWHADEWARGLEIRKQYNIK